jgi:hypothetical protein
VRASTETPLLDVAPGSSGDVDVRVVNTTNVIDGISARVIGLPQQQVSSRPAMLPLFPDDSGQLTVTLDVPRLHPAGRHPLTVEVYSAAELGPPAHVDLELVVPAHPAATLTVRPSVVRARRRGRFLLEVANRGNVPLDVSLRAVDADRALSARFQPAQLALPIGAVASSVLHVKAPRHLFGGDLDRPLTLELTGDAPGSERVRHAAPVTLRQRPLLPRGALTALILVSILGLWAAAFLFGLSSIFASDPPPKTAPASFYLGAPSEQGLVAAAEEDEAALHPPLAPGAGGSISGRVVARSDGQGVGRLVVDAVRRGRDGDVDVSSAATSATGAFTLASLPPGDYFVRITGDGFPRSWWHGRRPGPRQLVTVGPQADSTLGDIVLQGRPASISGSVDDGNDADDVTTTIVARLLQGRVPEPARRTTTADGAWTLDGLTAPGTYEISFTAPGYATTVITERVSAGAPRYRPTVRLSASAGSISGTVTDGSADATPLGGVTVTTSVAGIDRTVSTPTTGAVGRFVLGNLPTPGTYVLTFALDGFATNTEIVALGPGQAVADVSTTLTEGTGTVRGTTLDAAGRGLGGVEVSVGGAATEIKATSLTAGEPGAFSVSGLAAPGSYTLTFSKEGYASQSVPLRLAENSVPGEVQVRLARSVGTVSGVVRSRGGDPVVGATVTVTDGRETWTALTTRAGAGPAGGYRITGLPPGSYAVTATAEGRAQQTALVRLPAGGNATADLALGG